MAVAVDVLAEQRDLAEARGRKRPRLVHDLVERAAALGPAAERHDAVGAGLVAAVDDRQPGADRGSAADRATRDRVRAGAHEVRRVRDRGPVHDRRRGRRTDGRLGRGQAEPVDELRLLVGTQEHVDRGVSPGEAAAVRFAHRATRHHDAHPGVGGLEPPQVSLAADDLRLGGLPDRAGVDHDEIGGLHRRRFRAARGQQAARHLLGIALVHLAAERPDEERGQRPDLGPELLEPLVGGRERAARAAGAGDRGRDVENGQGSAGHAGAHGSACGQRPSAIRRSATSPSGITNPAWLPAYGPRSPW